MAIIKTHSIMAKASVFTNNLHSFGTKDKNSKLVGRQYMDGETTRHIVSLTRHSAGLLMYKRPSGPRFKEKP